MRILQVVPQVPYPLVDGGKIGIFNITRSLAERGHTITMLALDRTPGCDYEEVRRYCSLVTVPHSTRNTISGAIRNLASPLPYNVSKYRSRVFDAALSIALQKDRFDVVHVDHLHMAEYGLRARDAAGIPAVLREHNLESVIMERYAGIRVNPLMRAYLRHQAVKIRRHEGCMLRQFDCCCMITEADAERARRLEPSVRVRTIPAGVDDSFFEEIVPAGDKVPDSVAFVGGLDWIPNRDAVRWFADSVWPLVKQAVPPAKFVIIGKNPTAEIRALACESVVVMGFVPELRSELPRYAVSVAPFRVGGGLRLKIIESFALRVPVVSTSVGCEGIPAEHERHLLIEDSAQGFASAVVRVLREEAFRASLAREAFQLASASYRWSSVAGGFEQAYEHAITVFRGRAGG